MEELDLSFLAYQTSFLAVGRMLRARRGNRNLIYCLEGSRASRYTTRTYKVGKVRFELTNPKERFYRAPALTTCIPA